MQSYFDVQHWNRVKQARAELGLNRIREEQTLRLSHPLMESSWRHRESGELWKVSAVREDWLLGRYLTAKLVLDGRCQTRVVESITSEAPEIIQQLELFQTEFEMLHH